MYEIFEKLLKNKGVSAYQVSKDTGIAQSTFSDWKRGRCVPKQDKLQKIADYFEVSIDYLLTGKVSDGYYLNDETAQIAQQIFENKELRALFDVGRKSDPKHLKMCLNLLKELRKE